jgi:hypothetical protein
MKKPGSGAEKVLTGVHKEDLQLGSGKYRKSGCISERGGGADIARA